MHTHVIYLDQSSLSYLVRKARQGLRSQVHREMESYPSIAQDGHDITDTMYQLFGEEQQRGLPVLQHVVVRLLRLLNPYSLANSHLA